MNGVTILMNCVRWVGVLWLFLSGAIFPASAQDFNPVGFDPTPLRISSVEKEKRRAVTNMDLLTIRDELGGRVSPDGKYVAFVVVQAVYETNSYRTGMYIVGTASGSDPICLGT